MLANYRRLSCEELPGLKEPLAVMFSCSCGLLDVCVNNVCLCNESSKTVSCDANACATAAR